MAHIIPGVTFEKVTSPNSLIIPGGVAEVCIIGTAKTTKTIVEETLAGATALQEWPGTTVDLVYTPTGVESITTIIDSNGKSDYIAGATGDYYLDLVTSQLIWTGITGTNAPGFGVEYKVTYEATKVDADYGYKTFYGKDDVVAEYGEVSTTNTLSLAADLFFGNGGVRIHTIQMDGDDIAAYTAALAKLETEEIDVIVSLVPHNTTGFSTLFSVTKSHIFRMSEVSMGKNRMAFVSTSGTPTVQDYVGYGNAINYERMMLTAPVSAVITLTNAQNVATDYTVNSSYLNVAMAAMLANPNRPVAEPITRKEIFGFKSVTKKYLRAEVEALIEAGVLVVEQVGPETAVVIRVVQGITTDRDTIESNEITLVRLGDYFGKVTKNVLETMFIGGQINPRTMASMRGMITTISNSFIASGAILRTENISVIQSTLNPTLVDVSLKLVPIYPMNFIDIKFTIGQ